MQHLTSGDSPSPYVALVHVHSIVCLSFLCTMHSFWSMYVHAYCIKIVTSLLYVPHISSNILLVRYNLSMRWTKFCWESSKFSIIFSFSPGKFSVSSQGFHSLLLFTITLQLFSFLLFHQQVGLSCGCESLVSKCTPPALSLAYSSHFDHPFT